MSREVSINDQFSHAGLAAYFEKPVWTHPERAERLARLLVDKRWPWLHWWARYSGLHKRHDRPAVRVGGKSGLKPLLDGLRSEHLSVLDMDRAKGDGNFTSVMLDLDRGLERSGRPYELRITCRSSELPADKPFDAWLDLMHELMIALEVKNATLGAWPSYTLARSDTWLTRVVLDTPRGDVDLGLPAEFDQQIALTSGWSKKLGRTYARHPRWGTYLNAEHVAAIGGIERVRAEVQPARIDAVGELTYIQLTPTIDTAMTAEGGDKRRRLEAVMEPILVGNEARRRAAEIRR